VHKVGKFCFGTCWSITPNNV